MNYAEQIAGEHQRKDNIWDIFSSVRGGMTFGNLSKDDFCNTYKYAGGLSKSRIIKTNEFLEGTSESELAARWLTQNFKSWKRTLERWQFEKRIYTTSHGKTVPLITPDKLPASKLRQIRYEKYIEMWLHDQYHKQDLPATIYNASLVKINQASLGKCVSYEYFLRKGSSEAIDLISYIPDDKSRAKLYLMELKAGCSHETLLRCLLESYTYAKMIKPLWRAEFYKSLGLVNTNPQLVICPLFFDAPRSRPNGDFLSAQSNTNSQIRALARKIEEAESGTIAVEFARLFPGSLSKEIQDWLEFESRTMWKQKSKRKA